MDPDECSKVFSPLSALVGALSMMLFGLLAGPMYEYMYYNLDKPLFSRPQGDESNALSMSTVRHVHALKPSV